jgi:SPX domain protein involved in polyphosphate accumulation
MVQFGLKLRRSVYKPWEDKYVDYDKLKKLLREKDESAEWTDRDEEAFVHELINVQLEKVHSFQGEKSQELKERTAECDKRCNQLKESDVTLEEQKDESGPKASKLDDNERKKILEEVYQELEKITHETNELEKYSRINYTGFIKAAKKHDRKRGNSYKITPMLELRLAAFPFNQEDYSPLLYLLSGMYSFVRQARAGPSGRGLSFSDNPTGGEYSSSHKCEFLFPFTII